jgi:hypothetical protein
VPRSGFTVRAGVRPQTDLVLRQRFQRFWTPRGVPFNLGRVVAVPRAYRYQRYWAAASVPAQVLGCHPRSTSTHRPTASVTEPSMS